MTKKLKGILDQIIEEPEPLSEEEQEKESKETIEAVKDYLGNRWKEAQKRRYNNFGNYRLDRYIFQAIMVLSFVFLFHLASINNFDLDYFYCPENSDGSIQGSNFMLKNYQKEDVLYGCKNPFYTGSWKNQEYLPPGEYGTKPSGLFNLAGEIVFGLVILAILFNHLIHNRGKLPFSEDKKKEDEADDKNSN